MNNLSDDENILAAIVYDDNHEFKKLIINQSVITAINEAENYNELSITIRLPRGKYIFLDEIKKQLFKRENKCGICSMFEDCFKTYHQLNQR